jgi:hypothetical protein
MSAYPAIASVPYVTYSGSRDQKVLISNFDDLGKEQRKRKWLYQKRNITLEYRNISNANLLTLLEFYRARNGSYEAFSFFFPYSETYYYEYVCTGDGSETVFNLPFKTGSSISVYENNVLVAPADYAIGAGLGADGADNITFDDALYEGHRITCDFTGYLKTVCRFEGQIEFSRARYNVNYGNSIVVKLRGLLCDEE